MKRLLGWMCVAVLVGVATPAQAAFFDDFEGGVSGSVWTKWTGSNQEILQTSNDPFKNHTPLGTRSARQFEADPTGYSGYAGFGLTSGAVKSEVWLWDDLDDDGTN
ncbi:MAG: hypothetical protein SGJ20_21610, partial [Planctomycetota bacterium]|nr:hypothetical protein [Planctomycetota bacterium]